MRILEGLKMENGINSRMIALMSCARYLGIQESDAWMFGATGYAFVMHINESAAGIGPHIWNAEGVYNVGHNLGFAVYGETGMRHDADFELKQRRAYENTKRAIDRGYPCFGYHLAVPEYYVVNGYEDEGYFFSGNGADDGEAKLQNEKYSDIRDILNRVHGVVEDEADAEMLRKFAEKHGRILTGQLRVAGKPGYIRQIISDNAMYGVPGKAFEPWQRLGKFHIGLLEMFWLEPCDKSNDRDTVRESLQFALRFAEGSNRWAYSGYRTGPSAYESWISALNHSQPNAFGLAYEGDCWSECRKYAPLFLREAAERIGGIPSGLLHQAAAVYDEIYSHVRAVERLLPFGSWKPHHLQENDRLDRMISHLKEAKRFEIQGQQLLRSILESL